MLERVSDFPLCNIEHRASCYVWFANKWLFRTGFFNETVKRFTKQSQTRSWVNRFESDSVNRSQLTAWLNRESLFVYGWLEMNPEPNCDNIKLKIHIHNSFVWSILPFDVQMINRLWDCNKFVWVTYRNHNHDKMLLFFFKQTKIFLKTCYSWQIGQTASNWSEFI